MAIFFYYFIVINIILVDVFHDVTKKKQKKTKQLCYKKTYKNYIVWNMCFKRLVLKVCSLSVALKENGKLLNSAPCIHTDM